MPKARDCWTGDVPFNDGGHMLDYEGYGKVGMHPVKPFKAAMKIGSWSKGRSAVRIWVSDAKTGTRYPMFMQDFWDIITTYDIIDGVTPELKWTVCKKGANYGIKEYKVP